MILRHGRRSKHESHTLLNALPDGSGHEAVVGVGPRHDPIGFDLAVTFRGAAGSARAGCRQLD
jgi:hypothetical protein